MTFLQTAEVVKGVGLPENFKPGHAWSTLNEGNCVWSDRFKNALTPGLKFGRFKVGLIVVFFLAQYVQTDQVSQQ